MFLSMLKAATGSVATAVALNLAFAPALAAPIDPVQANVAKYVIPLVIPPQMPKSGPTEACSLPSICPSTDYNIAVRQFAQQILPGGIWNALNGRTDGFAPTTVWGYGAASDPIPNGLTLGGKQVQPSGVAPVPAAQSSFNYPSFTIEQQASTAASIRWINELVTIDPVTGKPYLIADARRTALRHLLPVDRTLHFANPERLPCLDPVSAKVVTGSTDCSPYANPAAPNPLLAAAYDGPVPMVVHVHGSEASPYSDGYPESWWLPAGRSPKSSAQIASAYATRGSHFDQEPSFRSNLYPGSAVYKYTNKQPATTLWYHDHTLGMTANNVYAGPAGFYLVRGSYTRADGVVVADKPKTGTLPGASNAFARPTSPKMTYQNADGKRIAGCDPNFDAVCRAAIREIPIAIQDRAFNADGSLYYPATRAYFDGSVVPYLPSPNSDVAPIHNPEFFGNMIVVNGTVWPSLNVVPQRYRLRLLAGADSRTFNLSLWAIPAGTTLDPNSQTYINDVRAVAREIPFYQIGAEQGFLPKVVKIKSGAAVALPGDGTEPTASCVPGANPGDATCMRGLTMVPAERADVIVDFTGLAAGTTVQMINDSSDVPFYGFPVDPSDAVNAASTGQIMRFVVTAPTATTPRDTSTAPASLVMASEPAYTAAITATKRISLLEEESKQICVQVAGDGSLTVAQTFTQPQADPMAACATANAIPFGPTETFVGSMVGGAAQIRHWADPITVAPVIGETDQFEIYNFTVDAHPMHLHGARMIIINREQLTQNPDGTVFTPVVPNGTISLPEANERGYKDVVNSLPGQVTRVKAKFETSGLYTWHCHIVEHEDNEMMIPICARAASTDKACKATPGGVAWPISNNGAGLSY